MREIYAFDCTSTSANASLITDWFGSHDTNFLRLVNGAYNFGTHVTIQQALDPSKVRTDVTVMPQDNTEYDSGNNSVYERYLGTRSDLRHDQDTQHQWAVSGGQMLSGKTSAYDPDFVETYFLNALRASAFLHL